VLYLYVAVGGAVGALARYGVAVWTARFAGPPFPWATLLINLAGCAFLGWLMAYLPLRGDSPEARALLAVGFCGSFTTFSTFGYELVLMMQRGTPGGALAYALGSVLLGVLGTWVGMWAGGLLG